MSREQIAVGRRRQEALDSLELEREREAALTERLEPMIRDAEAWRADEAAFARMPAEHVETLRAIGFCQPQPDGDSRARIEAQIADLEAQIADSRRRQEAFASYAEALGAWVSNLPRPAAAANPRLTASSEAPLLDPVAAPPASLPGGVLASPERSTFLTQAPRRGVTVPVFAGPDVLEALSPGESVEAVRRAFVEHARGAWTMPSKVYVEAPPDGDFRAMPAAGAGHAVLKWVTSFPGNPARGLPTVTGVVVLSDARTGALEALLDAAAVTARRTGAAAVLASEALARPASGRAGFVGCGVNGGAVASTFVERGRDVLLYDVEPRRAERVAAGLGEHALVAGSLEEALACDVVATVTPGGAPLLRPGTLRPGQHVSLMGADGPGKAEADVDELLRARIVCDEWEQASHNGEIAHAVAAARLRRADVVELGRVLAGEEPGREADDQITAFDSTGLAVQDLAIALAVVERYRHDAEAFPRVVRVSL